MPLRRKTKQAGKQGAFREFSAMLSDKSQMAPDAPRLFGLGAALKTALREVWDRLGLIIGVSSTWSLAVSIGYTVGFSLHFGASPVLRAAFAVLLTALLIAPATAGIFGVAEAGLNHEPQTYGDFWRHARNYGLPAMRLVLLHAAVIGLLALNLWYYAHVGGPGGAAAALLSFDALLVWGLMAVYHFPLLIAQESGAIDTAGLPTKRGVLPVLRRAFYLALGRPAYSFGLLCAALLLTLVALPVMPVFLIFWPGALAFALTAGTRNLLLQYDVIQAYGIFSPQSQHELRPPPEHEN